MTEKPVLEETLTERRRRTRSSIYHYLYSAEAPCAKQKIAADLNLSLPTVYQNLTELAEAGLIDYAGAQPSSGGRPAMNLAVVAGAPPALHTDGSEAQRAGVQGCAPREEPDGRRLQRISGGRAGVLS